jgi:hypothetical protein
MGRWKLHFAHEYPTLGGRPGGKDGWPAPVERARMESALFDLENDVGETKDVKAQYPEIVAEISKLADRMRADLGDSLREMKGSGKRPAGRLESGDARFVVKDGLQTPAEAP